MIMIIILVLFPINIGYAIETIHYTINLFTLEIKRASALTIA